MLILKKMVKLRRLNVGFSRGRETIHFVLSQPLDDFSGSIGEALRHYAFELEEAAKERSVSEVDPNSKMEAEVLNWFYQTEFWKNNKNKVAFIPQFEIGSYLRQLDPTYTHPMYKVDFLLAVRDDVGREQKIVIEYDGFNEHFKQSEWINKYNYADYYSDGDEYRQKILESYGYKFLRINRFNSGTNPVLTLNSRIDELLRPDPTGNPLMFKIQKTITGIQSGEVRECPKCREFHPIDEFRDPKLATGLGKICMNCKTTGPISTPSIKRGGKYGTGKLCPKCNSRMILRSGPRGRFYGCSRFPYCKGTRS